MPDSVPDPTSSPRPCFALRVRNTDRADVPLRYPSISVGGSPQCDLYLPELSSVAGGANGGVHCQFLHGPSGVAVRNWSQKSSLNGEAFRDATIGDGDVITLPGGVHLEIVQRSTSPPSATSSLASPSRDQGVEHVRGADLNCQVDCGDVVAFHEGGDCQLDTQHSQHVSQQSDMQQTVNPQPARHGPVTSETPVPGWAPITIDTNHVDGSLCDGSFVSADDGVVVLVDETLDANRDEGLEVSNDEVVEADAADETAKETDAVTLAGASPECESELANETPEPEVDRPLFETSFDADELRRNLTGDITRIVEQWHAEGRQDRPVWLEEFQAGQWQVIEFLRNELHQTTRRIANWEDELRHIAAAQVPTEPEVRYEVSREQINDLLNAMEITDVAVNWDDALRCVARHVASLRSERDDFERLYRELQSQVSDLKEDHSSQSEQLEMLRNELADAGRRLDALQEAFDEAVAARANDAEATRNAEAEVEAARAAAVAAEAARDAAQQDAEQARIAAEREAESAREALERAAAAEAARDAIEQHTTVEHDEPNELQLDADSEATTLDDFDTNGVMSDVEVDAPTDVDDGEPSSGDAMEFDSTVELASLSRHIGTEMQDSPVEDASADEFQDGLAPTSEVESEHVVGSEAPFDDDSTSDGDQVVSVDDGSDAPDFAMGDCVVETASHDFEHDAVGFDSVPSNGDDVNDVDDATGPVAYVGRGYAEEEHGDEEETEVRHSSSPVIESFDSEYDEPPVADGDGECDDDLSNHIAQQVKELEEEVRHVHSPPTPDDDTAAQALRNARYDGPSARDLSESYSVESELMQLEQQQDEEGSPGDVPPDATSEDGSDELNASRSCTTWSFIQNSRLLDDIESLFDEDGEPVISLQEDKSQEDQGDGLQPVPPASNLIDRGESEDEDDRDLGQTMVLDGGTKLSEELGLSHASIAAAGNTALATEPSLDEDIPRVTESLAGTVPSRPPGTFHSADEQFDESSASALTEPSLGDPSGALTEPSLDDQSAVLTEPSYGGQSAALTESSLGDQSAVLTEPSQYDPATALTEPSLGDQGAILTEPSADGGYDATEQEEVEEISYSSLEEDPPITAADVLNRMGVATPYVEESSDFGSDEIEEQTSVEQESHFSMPSVADGNDENDESIQQYMEQLLNRLGGKGNLQPAPPPPAKVAAEEPQAPVAAAPPEVAAPPLTDDDQVAQTVVVPGAVFEHDDEAVVSLGSALAPMTEDEPPIVPRPRPAGTSNTDLAAMRELANISARSAIDLHVKRRWGYAAIGKVTICAAAVITGFGLSSISTGWASFATWGAAVAFVIAGFWGVQAFKLVHLVLGASRLRHGVASTQDEKTTEEADVSSSV